MGIPMASAAVTAVLSAAGGTIAAVAFLQLWRIHFRNPQLGWTRQKMFHMMIGSSSIGYLLSFLFSLLATCEAWDFWLNTFGFVLIAGPQILFLAAFLLLLSFWADLCHQAKDDEDDDENGITESFLDSSKSIPYHVDGRRRCCSFRNIHVGSRQKCVILVVTLLFVLMIAFTVLICVGRGENPIDSLSMTKIYQDIISVAMLVVGGAFACYGLDLFSRMSKVKSEMASAETWKVGSLAVVTLVCFTSSSVLVLVSNIPVFYYWHADDSDTTISSILIFLYYLIGSYVPSGFVLWIMREMPPKVATDRPPESRTVTYVRETTSSSSSHNPWRTSAASPQDKAKKASPV